MNKIQLELSNLIGRKYVQGSYIIRGVVDYLHKNYEGVQDFDLRIRAPLYTNPIMVITDIPQLPIGTVASGSFKVEGQQLHYYLHEGTESITSFYEFDESTAEANIMQYQDYWTLQGSFVIDDPFIGWSVIERSRNLAVFEGIDPPGVKRKMWFTGIKLSNLQFLNDQLRYVQSSVDHTFITSTCICRRIAYNGIEVGQRFAVGKTLQP